MTAREEEQMTTPIDTKQTAGDYLLRNMSPVDLMDDLIAMFNGNEGQRHHALKCKQEILRRLHATTAAPPDVREAVAKAIHDYFDEMIVWENEPDYGRVRWYLAADAVVAALPSAPLRSIRKHGAPIGVSPKSL